MSEPHLLRRNGIFYYRRRVPLSLVEKFGKKVILFSLGTADPKEAKKRRALEAVKWDAQFDVGERVPTYPAAAHSGQKPAQGGLIELVRDYIERTDERSRTLLLAAPPDSMAQKADMKADLEFGRAILKNPDDPRGAQMVLPDEVELDARQTFYSFRHNFRDALRRAEAPPDALQALGGWSQGKNVSDDYGDKCDPDYQSRYLQRVAYALDLSFLHGENQ
jgi:hypothetical protein